MLLTLQGLGPYLALALVNLIEGRLVASIVDLHVRAEALPLRAGRLLPLQTQNHITNGYHHALLELHITHLVSLGKTCAILQSAKHIEKNVQPLTYSTCNRSCNECLCWSL